MAHQWDRGVLDASSWHGLEEIGVFTDAESLIHHGERAGSYPVALSAESLFTQGGLVAGLKALVAKYQAHPDRIVGTNGSRHRATTPDEWRSLIRAAVAAGAKPTGAFSLCEGSRVLATFDVGDANGLRTQLVLADSFDGTLRLTAGFTSVRVVCANTLAAAMREDGSGMAQLRHTASLETNVAILREGIADCVEKGRAVRDLFHKAERIHLPRAAAEKAFDALFPQAPEGASAVMTTRLENERTDAIVAARMPINKVGNQGGNLATLWNAATYLVDRNADGTARDCRGGADRLNSLLFGTRAKRLQEVQGVIERLVEVIRPDGTVETATVEEAVRMGVSADQASVLDWMLGN